MFERQGGSGCFCPDFLAMTKKKTAFAVAFLFLLPLAFLFLAAGAYLRSPVQSVVLYDDKGEVRYRFVPDADPRFSIRFLHSWARSPVDEIFKIGSDDVIVLVETIYEDFGAGLPHEPEAGQPRESMKVENGKIHIKNIDRPVPDLQVRAGRFVANHELIHGDKKIPLSQIVSPGGAVVFRVEKVERYTLWSSWEAGR